MAANLPLWMGTVPDYEVVDGQMRVTVGEFALAMPINVFLIGCVKGRQAIIKWESGGQQQADVLTFPGVERTAKH
jgi:hypothetical protein